MRVSMRVCVLVLWVGERAGRLVSTVLGWGGGGTILRGGGGVSQDAGAGTAHSQEGKEE